MIDFQYIFHTSAPFHLFTYTYLHARLGSAGLRLPPRRGACTTALGELRRHVLRVPLGGDPLHGLAAGEGEAYAGDDDEAALHAEEERRHELEEEDARPQLARRAQLAEHPRREEPDEDAAEGGHLVRVRVGVRARVRVRVRVRIRSWKVGTDMATRRGSGQLRLKKSESMIWPTPKMEVKRVR